MLGLVGLLVLAGCENPVNGPVEDDSATASTYTVRYDGDGTAYAQGATYGADADLTLYAEWHPDIAKILASDGESGDRFGSSVAMSGDYAVIGATGNDDTGDFSGSAYLRHIAP